jgi:hypothetical protein
VQFLRSHDELDLGRDEEAAVYARSIDRLWGEAVEGVSRWFACLFCGSCR